MLKNEMRIPKSRMDEMPISVYASTIKSKEAEPMHHKPLNPPTRSRIKPAGRWRPVKPKNKGGQPNDRYDP